MENQKIISNIALALAVIAIIGIVGYSAWLKKQNTSKFTEILPNSFIMKLSSDSSSSGANRNFEAVLSFTDNNLVYGRASYHSLGALGDETNSSCIYKSNQWVDRDTGQKCQEYFNSLYSITKEKLENDIKSGEIKEADIAHCGRIMCYELTDDKKLLVNYLEPNINQNISTQISDQMILDAENEGSESNKFIYDGKGHYNTIPSEAGSFGFSIAAKGDINGDGYQDAVVSATSCGASCGNNLDVIMNDKNGSAHKLPGIEFPGYKIAGALQTSLKSVSIGDGIISVTANNFEGDGEYSIIEAAETRNFRLIGNKIVYKDQSAVTVLYPNGGETFQIGDTMKISWKSSADSSSRVKVSFVQYHLDYNEKYPDMHPGAVRGFYRVSEEKDLNTGIFSYKIPSYFMEGDSGFLGGARYKVEVAVCSRLELCDLVEYKDAWSVDESDRYFTIQN